MAKSAFRNHSAAMEFVSALCAALTPFSASKKPTTFEGIGLNDEDYYQKLEKAGMPKNIVDELRHTDYLRAVGGLDTDQKIPAGGEDPVIKTPTEWPLKDIEEHFLPTQPDPSVLERPRFDPKRGWINAPKPGVIDEGPDLDALLEQPTGINPNVPLPEESPDTPGVPTFTEGGF